MHRGLFAILFVLGWGLVAPAVKASPATDNEALWMALKDGGHIALMRHALAPGTGDPAHFELDECATQRNLSAAGRAQARQIGQAFRTRGIAVNQVLSSRWCRCLETAKLLGLGTVTPFPSLDSFFRNRDRSTQQTTALKRFVSEKYDGPSKVLVTHQVNITALTDRFPGSGDIVVIRPAGEGFQVLGVISP